MTRFGDGFATGPDLVAAAERAAAEALAPLRGRTPDLAWVVVSGGDADETAAALERAAAATGARSSLGCGAKVALTRGAKPSEHGVAVLVAVLPGVRARTFHLEVMRVDAGLAVVGMPEPHHDDHLALLLADPWSFPADGFGRRVGDLLRGVPVVGGLLDPSAVAGASRLLVDGRAVDRGAVGAVLSGPVAARVVSAPLSRAVGPPMTVTAVDDDAVLGLADGRAADVLERMLAGLDAADQALATRGLQLGVAVDEYAEAHLAGDYLLRPVLAVDRARGAVVVAETVEVGAVVRFHVRDGDAALTQLRRRLGDLAGLGLDNVEALLAIASGDDGPGLAGALELADEVLAGPASIGMSASAQLLRLATDVDLQAWTTTVIAFGSGSGADRGTAN